MTPLKLNNVTGAKTRFRRRLIATLAALLPIVGAAGVAFAMPGATACALVDFMDLDSIDHGLRVAPDATAGERRTYVALYLQARARIRTTLGEAASVPIVMFLKDPAVYFPFSANPYGSTHFIGSRACAVVGPEGMNVDVTAHELVHAETFHRVGFWARLTEVPVWFDEGLGMQVDHRPEFVPDASMTLEDKSLVTELESTSEFFVNEPRALRQNFTRAKGYVALWVKTIGAKNVYRRLERLKNGESFGQVFEHQ